MNAQIITTECIGKVEYHNVGVVVNGKAINMELTIKDGSVSYWQSRDSDIWNSFSEDEKEAVSKEIFSYFNY